MSPLCGLRRPLPPTARAALLASLLLASSAGAQLAPPVLTPAAAAPTVAAASIATLTAAAAPWLSFSRAFDAALGYDAQFDAARHERDVTQGGVPVAFAALLPTLNLSLSDSRSIGTREFPNSLNQQVTLDVDYKSPQAVLQLRAPLFNYEALSRYRQAKAQAEGADSVYQSRGADLLDRLSVAFLQQMLADENVRQAQVQAAWLAAQLERVTQRLQRGEGTRIETADAQAQLDLARAKLLDARDLAVVARRGLARITGLQADRLPPIDDKLPTPPLQPQSLIEWQSLALRNNASIRAREQSVEVARQGVQRNRAGHLPRLDMVASLSKNSNESLANLNQSSRLANVGLQLNVPLYSGGGVQASIKQAQSDVLRTEAELSNERRNVELEVQRQFLAATHGQERIQAYVQAVASSEVVLEGVTRGVAAGIRSASEVLEAGARLQLARRDLAQARVEYLLARTRLMAQSGAAPVDVVADIDRLLSMR